MNQDLAGLQRAFLASMRDDTNHEAMSLLADGRGIAPDTGLAIYRNAYGARLREALDHLRQEGLFLDTLSMGMSDDLEAAIAEGATLVRAGTAIFGERNQT